MNLFSPSAAPRKLSPAYSYSLLVERHRGRMGGVRGSGSRILRDYLGIRFVHVIWKSAVVLTGLSALDGKIEMS